MAERQHDSPHHCHQQDEARELEEIDVVRIENEAQRMGIGDAARRGRGRAGRTLRQRRDDPGAEDERQLHQKDDADDEADGQIGEKSLSQLGEIDVEHHDDEEEQHRHGADIDHDQDHGQELRPHEHEEPGGAEERQDQEQDGVDRIARRHHHHARGDGDGGEGVEGDDLNDHGVLIDRARRPPDWRRSRLPSGRRYPAASACRRRAPRGSPSRIRSWAPPRWRPPGRLPGTSRNRCIWSCRCRSASSGGCRRPAARPRW